MAMRTVAMTILPALRARPYSRLASAYDAAIGAPSFCRTRQAFERIVAGYGVDFRSAADLGCGTGLFACYLARRWAVPSWARAASRYLAEPWFGMRSHGGRMILLAESPAAFRVRNIFVSENALSRA